MRLRRPTEWHRFTVDQNGSVSIDANQGQQGPIVAADPQGVRRITLCTPSSPTLLVAIDQPPEIAGPNRTGYKWAPVPSSVAIVFHLAPNQQLFASVGSAGGFATGSFVIEYPAVED